MPDTKVGQDKKADPVDVAKAGFDAMLKGDGQVIAGFKNKVQAAMSHVVPSDALAEMHRGLAEPGRAKRPAHES
jgi:short-subunit dehydrogenase